MNSIVKRLICITMVACAAATMLGCQQNPENPAVASKNDGAFDINVVQSATEPADGEKIRMFSYEDKFTSTDRSVNFTLDIEGTCPTAGLPVVEVEPHYLTGEDVKQVAYSIFGDVDFYEARPILGDELDIYSKREIVQFLNRWSMYANQDALDEVFGQGSRNKAETVRNFIEQYTEMLESAKEEIKRAPCEWVLKPDSVYLYSGKELEAADNADRNFGIEAELEYQNLPYRFGASTRNRADFKMNYIYGMLDNASPAGFDRDLLTVPLQKTSPPTQEALEKAKRIVSDWLNGMGLGEWEIDECKSNCWSFGQAGVKLWRITIRAVPVFNGASAIRREQLNNLKSDEVYASNYYITDAEFNFSANGKLLDFWIYSPVDVKTVINEHVATIEMDELVERAKQQLSLSDIYEYSLVSAEEVNQFSCNVDISRLEYGLSRVKVPNTDESYYYVPSITLWGTSETIYKETGDVWYGDDEERVLLILNAIDGTVIDSSGV